MWDNNKDHSGKDPSDPKTFQFEKLSELARAVARAAKSGRGFRFAYVGDASPEAFEIWSQIYWEILDGNRITYGIIEEYSDCCRGPGALSQKRDKYHRRLWTQGRKYGAILHATSQRPQLISKDALGNAGVIWASRMDKAAAKRIAEEIDISVDELRSCGVGEFFCRISGSDAERIRVYHPI